MFITTLHEYILDNYILKRVDKMKDLGVVITPSLCPQEHIAHISGRAKTPYSGFYLDPLRNSAHLRFWSRWTNNWYAPAILEYGRSSDRLISWITLIKAAFSIQSLKMFCHGFILTYRTIIRPSSPALSTSTCGSSSSHQTGEWPQNATSTVQRSLVALISPYPKEPARG